MHQNQIYQIDKETFKGLKHLVTIDLDSNKITKLEKETFNGLVKLKSIDLDNNQITQLDVNTFRGLKQLSKIFIYNNRFKCNKLELNTEANVKCISFKSIWNNI